MGRKENFLIIFCQWLCMDASTNDTEHGNVICVWICLQSKSLELFCTYFWAPLSILKHWFVPALSLDCHVVCSTWSAGASLPSVCSVCLQCVPEIGRWCRLCGLLGCKVKRHNKLHCHPCCTRCTAGNIDTHTLWVFHDCLGFNDIIYCICDKKDSTFCLICAG